MKKLQDLYEEIKGCKRCALGKERTNLVFGAGNEEAEILFVGEAPGYHEDKMGEPFVGQAGKLLTQLLSGIGLKRSDIYITNVLKCRPPKNRDPSPKEVEACKPYLFTQIEIIKPKVVCTLGNFATRALLDKQVSISSVVGKNFQVKNFWVFPIFHPAVALHRGDMVEPLRVCFKKLKKFLKSGIKPEVRKEQLNLL